MLRPYIYAPTMYNTRVDLNTIATVLALLAVSLLPTPVFASSAKIVATAESDSYTCMMTFTAASDPNPSVLRLVARPKTPDSSERAIAQYVSADDQGYIRFHEPDVIEFAQGNRNDEYAEIGVMLVNFSSWEGDEIIYSDAAEYDGVNNGYFLEPVIDGGKVALISSISEERHRFYRIKIWEPTLKEWHEALILGAKEVAVSFESENDLDVKVDWGEGRLNSYRLDLRSNQYIIK